MINKKYKSRILGMFTGVIFTVIGFSLMKINSFLHLDLLFAIIGVGGLGLFGSNLGEICRIIAIKKDPEMGEKYKIKQNDERNILITNIAKSKAFDLLSYIFGIVIFAYALSNIESTFLFLLIGIYLLMHGVMIYYTIKLKKDM